MLLIASLSISISITTDADISHCFSETLSVNVVFNTFHIELKDSLCLVLMCQMASVYIFFFFFLNLSQKVVILNNNNKKS